MNGTFYRWVLVLKNCYYYVLLTKRLPWPLEYLSFKRTHAEHREHRENVSTFLVGRRLLKLILDFVSERTGARRILHILQTHGVKIIPDFSVSLADYAYLAGILIVPTYLPVTQIDGLDQFQKDCQTRMGWSGPEALFPKGCEKA